MTEQINYPKIIDDSMRNVVSQILSHVEQHGLQGNHHFYISFLTQMFGVSISENIKKDYPEEITIVLQHQFENLKVEKTKFSVTLMFGGVIETLVIPFKAITAFSDPSVKFTIEFTSHDPIHITEEELPEEADDETSNVITLDKFRDKNKK